MSDGMTDMNGGSPAVWREASAVTPPNQGNYNKWKEGRHRNKRLLDFRLNL